MTEGGRAFFQRRVGTFGLVMAGIFGFGVLVRFSTALAGDLLGELFSHPTFGFHVAAGAVFLSMWLICRNAKLTTGQVRTVDALGTWLGTGAVVCMGCVIELESNPEGTLVALLMLCVIARAIWVPSSARRTLLIGAPIGVFLVVGVYVLYADADVAAHPWLAQHWTQWSEEAIAEGRALGVGVWWIAALAVSAGASGVIYGLRREVREARKLGPYTVEGLIGEGAMGRVYRAQHALLRRPTAIKLLHGGQVTPLNEQRFAREVQLTARLSHPNTITVFDYGHTPDGVFYYAMELLDGPTLEDIVTRCGALPASRAVHFLTQLAGALTEAHEIGLIHRDIKPSNVIVATQGGTPDTAKLLDFGLVRDLSGATGETLSESDRIAGTPLYLSPEAIRTPDDVDARSDLYALGALGYFLLAGRPPFVGETVMDVCAQHLSATPEPLEAPDRGALPEALTALISSSLAKDPDDRPASARAFAAALAAIEIGTWTLEDAAAWWRGPGQALGDPADRTPDSAAGLTVDIART